MGFRFSKSFRVLPGVRVNLSRSGISTTLGGRGASVNVSKRGTRATVGLPGTGLSYTTPVGRRAAGATREAQRGVGLLGLLGRGVVWLVGVMVASALLLQVLPAAWGPAVGLISIGLVSVAMWWWTRSPPTVLPVRQAEPEEAPDHDEDAAPQLPPGGFKWPALGHFDADIVGESFYQPVLARLAGNHGDFSAERECEALLLPEPDNEHDALAVAVLIDGHKVGYLGRDEARLFRRRLGARKLKDQPTRCDAMIVGGGKAAKSSQRFHYGVRLDIKPLDV